MQFKVYSESVRQSAPDPFRARCITIGEQSTLVFEGDAKGAVAALKAIGIGRSVAVRYSKPDGTGTGGIRSCMNKPALWDWINAGAPRRMVANPAYPA